MRLLLHKTNLFTTALNVPPQPDGSTQDQYFPTVSPTSVFFVNQISLFSSQLPNIGFEYRRGHGYLSVVSVVCCQVEVSVTS